MKPDNQTVSHLEAIAQSNRIDYPCPKCGKVFLSPQALRMHRIRVHTRAGLWGAKLGVRRAKSTRAARLQRKREYNKLYRERLKREGRLVPSQTAYRKARDRYYRLGLNAKGKPYASKGGYFKGARDNKRIQYVYPLPEEGNITLTPPIAESPEWIHAQLHYCPKCGEQLTKWKKQT